MVEAFFRGDVGGLCGTSSIKAPLVLSNELAELPTELIAIILTWTTVPCGKLKGSAIKVVKGTLQFITRIMPESDPLQVAVDSE